MYTRVIMYNHKRIDIQKELAWYTETHFHTALFTPFLKACAFQTIVFRFCISLSSLGRIQYLRKSAEENT